MGEVRLPDIVRAGPVELRRPRAVDAPALVAAMASSLDELAPWFEWAQRPPSLEEQTTRLAAADRAFDAGTDYEFAIIDTQGLVGALRLNPSAGPNTAGVGYWVRSDRHRRGYATAATAAVTTTTFASLSDVERIEVHMDQANVASVGVPRGLGYVLDREVDREILASGHTGRGFVWVTTRAEWARLHPPST